MTHSTDVAIIGAGPVGLFAVFECGMLGMRCHVIDALDAIGGQCAALYPEKPIYDIPGHPQIDGLELIEKLEAQAAPFAPTYHLEQRVEGITSPLRGEVESRSDSGGGDEDSSPSALGSSHEAVAPCGSDNKKLFTLTTSTGTAITAKALIIAAGCGAFGPNRPPLEGIEAYEGSSVFYMVTRKEAFRGKKIVIAGGGDSAVDWALSLADVAEKLYVVHRRPKFRAAPESLSRMEALAEAGKIEIVVPYQLAGLEGDGGQLSGVRVATLDGEEKTLEADILLPFFGLAMELGPIADWGLNLHKNHIAVDPATCETNQPGLFAVGDIATYKNKLKLILCGFSEVAMAARAIHPLVHPDTALHFEYSTSAGVPGGM